MEFIATLARQPLFRLLGAIIVLLFTAKRPLYGVIAFCAWAMWVWWGSVAKKLKGA
jgi:hypothetical protein